MKVKKLTLVVASLVALVLLYIVTVAFRLYGFKFKTPSELTEDETLLLTETLNKVSPNRNALTKKLPYATVPARLTVASESAIVIDSASGSVLFEKNADNIIPPASMTKIAVMYVVMQELQAGSFSLDTIVPLPKECWASTMMAHSSLMFLGKDQIVTVEELLTGLAVCSGNDAAYALAFFVSGSMEKFIERMNSEMKTLGLTKTRFVESSGYSEKNTTTAREMASLARAYISRFPETLSRFHSVLSFTYPKEKNLPASEHGKVHTQDFSHGLPDFITMGITQQNTNSLLGKLSGCDGLKTGYIDESGYNLTLTCHRGETRFISVTLKGPGKNTLEGNRTRENDGRTIMEWAFAHFATYKKNGAVHAYRIPVTSGNTQWVRLVPLYDFTALTVPFIAGETPSDSANNVVVRIDFPRVIDGGTYVGKAYGSISFSLAGKTLETIPLCADRTIKKANLFVRLADLLPRALLQKRDNADN